MNQPRFSRRSFLANSVAIMAVAGTQIFATKAPAADRYAGLKSADFFAGPMNLETAVVDRKVFTEGPAAAPDGRIFFTNTEAAKILIWDPARKELSPYRDNSGEANGLLFDKNGQLLACEGKSGRVTRSNLKTGEISVLANQFDGHPLGAPNDLTLDQQGRIYFTSRFPSTAPKDHNVNAVYRIDSDGSVACVLKEPDIHMPNGVEVSPDGKTLYLIESDGREGRNRCVLAYDLKADGMVTHVRRLYEFYPGRGGDGLCVDIEGNLYVAAGLHATRGTHETLDTRPGIHVISPSGTLLAFAETPADTVTNCTFGGQDRRTLYVTCGKQLLSIRTRRPGPA